MSFKYWAFISYSSKDRVWGEWLIQSLERYRVPRSLVGLKTGKGVVPRRLFPVFRDRDELRVGADVGEVLGQALLDSRYLIVVCSPNSAAPSSWVSREIRLFKASGRQDDVLAVIVDGEPNASLQPDGADRECFPLPLRYRFDDAGQMTEVPVDPLASDVRREDSRSRAARRKALLKLVARIIEVDFDTLEQRDRRRNRQRAAAWVAFAAVALTVLSVLTVTVLRESRTSLSQQIAQQARDQVEVKTNLALLSSVLAYRISPTPAAYESLLAALQWNPNLIGHLYHATKVLGVAFDPEDTAVAVASCEGDCAQTSVTSYDPMTLRSAGPPIKIAGMVTQLRFQPKSQRLLVVRKDGNSFQLLAFDPKAPAAASRQLYACLCEIKVVEVSADGSLWAVATDTPPEIKVFDEHGRRCGESPNEPALAMAFSPDGRRLALATRREIRVLELAGASPCTTESKRGPDQLSDLAFDPSSSQLYMVARDGTISQWVLSPGQGRDETFSMIEYSPEGYLHAFDRQTRYLVSKHADHLRIYDLDARRTLISEGQEASDSLVAQEGIRRSLSALEISRLRNVVAERIVISPSGKLLATADAQGTVMLWTIHPRPIVEMSDSNDEPASKAAEAASPDGRLRARVRTKQDACGSDNNDRCRVWTELSLVDVGSGMQIARLAGPDDPLRGFTEETSAAFSADGNLTSRRGGLTERWTIAPEALLQRACRVANRQLTDAETARYFSKSWHRLLRPTDPCGPEMR